MQYWRCKSIIQRITHQAHLKGIRVSTVYPAGTSLYAYDGSGEVDRSITNYSLCKFKTNKIYNTDLNASYNIGSRYFLRSIRNEYSDQIKNNIGSWSLVLAKDPGLLQVKMPTLSTLRLVNQALSGRM